ncbi:hypothetical protein B484DRAFT_445871 [Ochromonadaceae sp. CCMP2298]|nr:hypothetical protein B484DRAFT_445871 [Ochromonadaceae sp. CCMP2298]
MHPRPPEEHAPATAHSPQRRKMTASVAMPGIEEAQRRPAAPLMAIPVIDEAQRRPVSTYKWGRKATRRFSLLENIIPRGQFDEALKLTIATSLQAMDAWSDDEGTEEQKEEAEAAAARRMEDKDKDGDDSGCASGEEEEFSIYTSPRHPPDTEEGEESNEACAPAVPVSIQDKQRLHADNLAQTRLRMQRPKQLRALPATMTAQREFTRKLQETQLARRRQKLVLQSVEAILRKRRNENSAQQEALRMKLKTLSATRQLAVHVVAKAAVGAALAKALKPSIARAAKKIIKEEKRVERVTMAVRRITSIWSKYRVYKLLMHVVLHVRRIAADTHERWERETDEFRMRAAHRRVAEDVQMRQYLVKCRKEAPPLSPSPPSALKSSRALPQALARARPFQPGTAAPRKPAEQHDGSVWQRREEPCAPVPAATVRTGQGKFPSKAPPARRQESPPRPRPPLPQRAVDPPGSAGASVRFSSVGADADVSFHRPDLAPFSAAMNKRSLHSALLQSQYPQQVRTLQWELERAAERELERAAKSLQGYVGDLWNPRTPRSQARFRASELEPTTSPARFPVKTQAPRPKPPAPAYPVEDWEQAAAVDKDYAVRGATSAPLLALQEEYLASARKVLECKAQAAQRIRDLGRDLKGVEDEEEL